MLKRIGKWTFLIAGLLGVYFSLAAWFLVPGIVDLNRFIVAGIFASLATNSFLLSGVLFHLSNDGDNKLAMSFFRTPPVIIAGLFLLVFALIAVSSPWWGRH
jgi:hypothetical protein